MIQIEKSFVGIRPRTTHTLTLEGKRALRAYKKEMVTILEALPD